MKNKIGFLLFLVLTALAVPAFAALPTALKDFSGDGEVPKIRDANASPIIFSLSPNVGIAYNVTSDADGYTLVTANAQGTKGYGVQHNFQGVLVTKADYDEDLAAPDVNGWAADTWMVMGSPAGKIPGAGAAGDEDDEN